MVKVTTVQGMEIPEMVLDGIPENATREQKLSLRAQIVIQSAFYTFGNRENSADTAILDRDELTEVIAVALGMLVCADTNLQTKRDIRLQSETIGKFVGKTALNLRAMLDDDPELILKAIGLQSSPAH